MKTIGFKECLELLQEDSESPPVVSRLIWSLPHSRPASHLALGLGNSHTRK